MLTLPAAPHRDLAFGHDALVVCDNVVRIYQSETIEVQALQGLDLLVHEGELVALVGASGSGKSTLLNILAGVDAPTAGRAEVAGHDLVGMSRTEQVHYRRHGAVVERPVGPGARRGRGGRGRPRAARDPSTTPGRAPAELSRA